MTAEAVVVNPIEAGKESSDVVTEEKKPSVMATESEENTAPKAADATMEEEKPTETETSSKEAEEESESKDGESKTEEAGEESKDTDMAEVDAEQKPKPAEPSNGSSTKAGIAAPKRTAAAQAAKAASVPKPKPVPAPAPEAEVDDDLFGAPFNEKCQFSSYDCSLNVTVAEGLIQGVTESSMSLLAGGSRCQVGVEPGQRAYYEVKALDLLISNMEHSRKTGATANMLRIGFGSASCDLILGSCENSCGFDAEGSCWTGTTKKLAARRFGKADVIGILLNTIKGHVNENTISMFKNGVRLCQPQPIPESLHGTVLYPLITVKNCSVLVNLGLFSSWSPLKWKQGLVGQCKELRDNELARPENGVYECVVPCGIPNSGLYPYVDSLQKKTGNKYIEISARAFIDWAKKSGHRMQTQRTCLDSAQRHFGVALLDNTNSALLRMIELAKFRGRHIIMVDAFNSLFNRSRHMKLREMVAPRFKKIAHICMGDLPEDVQELRGESPEVEVDQATITGCRIITEACLPSEMDAEKVAAQEAEEEAEKAIAEEEAKAAAEKAEKEKAEAAADAEVASDAEDAADKKMEVEEQKPIVVAARPRVARQKILLFDEYQYVWGATDAEECLKLFDTWLDVRKMETFVDVVQSPEFKKNLDEWLHTKLEWRRNQKEYNEKTKKERADYTTAKTRIETANATKKKKFEAAKRMYSNKMRHYEVMKAKKEKEGEEYNVPVLNEPEEPEYEEVPENPFKDADEETDVWLLDDIMDIGGGAPLFANFSTEDWQLLNLRYELHLLILSFLRDVKDERRKGIHIDLIGKYYEVYYKRQLVPRQFGCDSMRKVLEMVEDSIKIDDELDSVYGIFMKLTEERRRERQAAIEAGDESVKLNFAQPTASALRPNRGIVSTAPAPRRNSAPQARGGGNNNAGYGRGSAVAGSWGARLMDKRGGGAMQHHDHKRMRR